MNIDVRSLFRRANPFLWLALGGLVGGLVTGVGGSNDRSSRAAAAGAAGATTTTVASVAGSGGAGVAEGGATGAAAADGAPTSTGSGPGTGGTAATVTAPGGTVVAGAPAGDGCAGVASSGVTGVTAKSVKVGFAIPDISAMGVVFGAQVDPGDMAGHVRAILDGMRKDGRLPVCGRDIQAVYRQYNILDPAQARSVCVGFTEQDHVFAVVSLFGFTAADCVTVEHRTFLIDLGGQLAEADYRRSPLLFTTDPVAEAQFHAVAHWLVESHLADGKTIGVYYNTNSAGDVQRNLIDVLAQLGHPVKVVVTTDADQLSGSQADPNDSVAVQRFRAGGVTLALPLSAGTNFYRQAQLQAYKTQWAVYGVAFASDATTAQNPKDTFDGALALLFDHVGEVKSNVPLSAEEQRCYGYWRAAGHQVPNADFGEGQTIRESCDQVTIFTHALAAAGNNLTSATLIAGMEGIRNLPMSYYSDQTFARGKHWGTTKNVMEQWHGDCSCWKLAGPWGPLYGYP